jgi:hypothetical protein
MLSAKLDIQQHNIVATQNDHQQILASKLDAQEKRHVLRHTQQQRAIANVHRAQNGIISRHESFIWLATRT